MQYIKKRGLSLLFAGILLVSLIGCAGQNISSATQEAAAVESTQEATAQAATAEIAQETESSDSGEVNSSPEDDRETIALDEDGAYTTKEDVALYLYIYHRLPDNFMTKKEARELGWTGGSLEPYASGMCIGGDYYGNYEEVLPEGTYHECDIDTLGMNSRGAKRIVYSEDWQIYYTEDHYESFELLYGAE